MTLLHRLASLWRNITRRSRIERDLDDEMQATLECLADEKVRAGMAPMAARKAAALELGGVEPLKERIRDARAGAILDGIGADVRYAARLLRRYPIFAVTTAVSLAIGIGANTAVFTIANSLLRFSPSAVADPDRLVDIGRSLDGITFGFNPASYPDYLDIRNRTKTLDHVYAHMLFPRTLSLVDTSGMERVAAEIVTTNYFATLGTQPAAGRLFAPDESDRAGESPIVVLSHRFWTRRFNADPAIVGQTVRLNRYPMTIVGVAPEGFQGTTVVAVDMWVPLSMVTFVTGAVPAQLDARRAGWLVMGARLKPGATVAQAASELDAIDRALRVEHPGEVASRSLRVMAALPLAGNTPLAVAAVVLLGAIATTVLVIACANVAGLLLARASGRGREMALRLAIGAGRWRLVRQLLIETLMLFAISVAVGVVLARMMTSMLVGLLPALPIPIQISLGLDWRVVAFACALSFVAALLSGLAPALHASRANVSTVLKDESQGASSRLRMRNAFVVAQVALSLLLIVVGGLFARALQASSAGAGFDSSGVDVASLDLAAAGYTDTTGPAFARELIDGVRQLPGVEAASITRVLPLASEGFGFGLSLPGALPLPGQSSAEIGGSGNIIEPGYFEAMRIPLLAGRDFTERDAVGTPLVAVIGEAAARRFWPEGDPIGKPLVVSGPGMTPAVVQVIGVARDIPYRNLNFGNVPFVYVPLRQHYSPNMTLVIRSGVGRSAASQVRRLVAAMNGGPSLESVQSLDDAMVVGLTPQRIGAVVAGSLGIVGVLLAAIGVYGVTAYTVARRTRELAIRSALGAQRGRIVALVLRQTIAVAGIGTVMGLLLAALAGQGLSLLLVGVSPIDPFTFLIAAGVCGAVALSAAYVPVHRAMRINASDALRYE